MTTVMSAVDTPTSPDDQLELEGEYDNFVHEGTDLHTDLLLVKVTIRSPSWRLQMKQAAISSPDTEGHDTLVTGKTTRPCFKLDVHDIFDEINANTRTIERTLDQFTVVDAEDGFRLVSIFNKERFLLAVAKCHEARMQLADRLDILWPEVVAMIEQQFPRHFWQIKSRLPRPRFAKKLDVRFSLRPLGVLTPEQLDFDTLSTEGRSTLLAKMTEQAEGLVNQRVEAIIDGAMQPIMDLAMEINGEKPNPKFDPSKPVSKKNARFLPGIDSGHKKSGFLDALLVNLERVLNFRQFMSAEVIDQVEHAIEVIGETPTISALNGSEAIQRAIRNEMNRLGGAMRQHASTVRRSTRAVSL